ncbi:MAG: translocation protein TolB [Planctomycetota bacterium]
MNYLRTACRLLIGPVLLCIVSSSPVTADEKPPGVKRVRFYTAPAEGGDTRLYFEPGDYHTAGSPALSADGQKLAFDGRASQNGERFQDGKIMVTNADGSGLKAIGSGVMPSWSPQGNRIAFSQISPSGVAIMHADGSLRNLIEEGGWGAQWSPDGRKIAYSVSSSGKANIRVYDLIEETKTDLFPEGESPYNSLFWNMSWSPDSNWLCFKGHKASDSTYDVATINVAGMQAGYKVHYNNKQAPYADFAWHPQGDKIVFAGGASPRQFLQFNPAEDKAPEPLAIKVNGTIIGDVCFTPDGQSLLFNVSGTGE